MTDAHCGETGERVGVTSDAAYQAGERVYYGTFLADPLYNQSQSDPHDIAVVVFDKAIKGITPALSPTADSLSNLSSTQAFTSVGYGAYEMQEGRGPRVRVQRRAHGGHRYAQRDECGLAANLDEPGNLQRRHLLRRLRRAELPRHERS